MKAKDLAALAALGVAGYAAYDKFGKKGEEPKTRGKLGESQSANDGTAGEYRSDMLGKGRSANDEDAGESEARMSRRSRQENDAPDFIMGRDAAGSRFTDRAAAESPVIGKDAAGSRFTDKAAVEAPAATSNAFKKVKTAAAAAGKSLNSQGGPSRYSAAQDSQAASSAAPVTSSAPVVGRVGIQPAMDAYSRATRPAAGNQAMAAMERATVPAQRNASSGNAAMDAFSQVKAVPRNIQYATEAEKARQARIDEQNYDSDLMKSRRQAVVDTLQNIPSGIANIFKPPEKVFQNKTYFNPMTNKVEKYKKGGVVKKMASGGLASSKMSKPSGASRGDGIAQRGRTRGTLR